MTNDQIREEERNSKERFEEVKKTLEIIENAYEEERSELEMLYIVKNFFNVSFKFSVDGNLESVEYLTKHRYYPTHIEFLSVVETMFVTAFHLAPSSHTTQIKVDIDLWEEINSILVKEFVQKMLNVADEFEIEEETSEEIVKKDEAKAKIESEFNK